MDNNELARLLNEAKQYNTGFGGNITPIDDWRNAQSRLNVLNANKNNIGNNQYDTYNRALKTQKFGAVATGIGTIGNGLLTAIGSAQNSAQIQDNSDFETQLAYNRNAGNQNYYTYDQYAKAMSNYQPIGTQTFEDNRGIDKEDRWKSIASPAMQGAAAGASFGPWGAAIGGLVGAGIGAVGLASGDRKAETQTRLNNVNAAESNYAANANFNAGFENLKERDTRDRIANSAASGGQLSIKDFAAKVLNEPAYSRGPSGRIVRIKGEGGTIIRIKK